MWKWEWNFNRETCRSIDRFLRRTIRPMDLTCSVEDLAALLVSHAMGCRRGSVRRIQRSQLLDRDCDQHAARIDRLCDFCGAWHDSGTWRRQQQVPRRNHGWIAGKPAEPAQHLLVASGAALVRPKPKCNSVCRHHGITVIGHIGHGGWSQADAQDLWHGRAQP